MLKSCIRQWFLAGILVAVTCGAAMAARPSAWTVDDLLSSPTPFALGHRGYGANDGEDPTRPLANTLDAFHQAFTDGIRVVELDLQQTADGKVVVYHDDYLADFTCIRSLTYDELLARKPEIPLFRAVLNSCRHFSRVEDLSGILFAEIKVPVPLCDGANTSAQAEISESALVAAVIADIRQAGMEDQVILNSGSPTILRQVALQAPEIKRALTLNVLQLLTPEQVAAALHLPVVLIPKNDFGLAWYNIGSIARLPAIPSFPAFIGLSLAVGSRAVSLDKLVLFQAGAGAPNVVAALHGAGLKAVVWTIENGSEWDFVAGAGADGITTNDIALGLARQAPLPAPSALLSDGASRTAGDAGFDSRGGGPVQKLALSLSGPSPSRDGTARLRFALPGGADVALALYDISGRRIATLVDGPRAAGEYDEVWRLTDDSGRPVAPGVYLAAIRAGASQATLRVVVVR